MKTLNKTIDVIRLGLHSLLTHKVRSLLTSLGIIIGVCSVVVMLAINKGLSYEAQKSLEEMGSNNILIESVKPPNTGTKASGGGRALVYGLTYDDAAILSSNLPGVVKSVSVHKTSRYAHYDKKNTIVSTIATSPDFVDVAKTDISSGRFINKDDMDETAAVCLISEMLRKQFFQCKNPLGETIRFNGEPFKIIGVISRLPRSLSGGSGEESLFAIIPLSSARKRFGKISVFWGSGGGSIERVDISQLILQMQDKETVLSGAEVARQVLEREHDEQDYDVIVPLELIKQLKRQRRLWNLMFFIIASVSLVVGGIGITNIMLASVSERTREIGIRRALGARRRDIIIQFLIEAVTLTTFGGLIGIAVGLLIPMIISQLVDITTITTASTLILPLVMAIIVGIVSGLYPAIWAAKLDPIIALRYE